MNPEWAEYKCKSGETLFLYNKKTGEHRWLDQSSSKGGIIESIEIDCIWTEYKCKSGETLFLYNKKTGRHLWPVYKQLDKDKEHNNSNWGSAVDSRPNSSHNNLGLQNETALNLRQEHISITLNTADQYSKEEESVTSVKRTETNTTSYDEQAYNQGNKDISTSNPAGKNSKKVESATFDKRTEDHDDVRLQNAEQATDFCDKNISNPSNTCDLKCRDVESSDCNKTTNEQKLDLHCESGSKLTQEKVNIGFSTAGAIVQSNDENLNGSVKLPLYDNCNLESEKAEGKKKPHKRSKHQCRFCNKRLSSQHSCIRHERRLHTGIKPHKCQQCDKAYTSYWELKMHNSRHHEARNHHCHLCNRSFRTLCLLQWHERRHNPDYSHPCRHCEMEFKSYKERIQHERTHHDETVQCRFCEMVLLNDTTRLRHERRLHTSRPYKCTQCPKTYAYPWELKRHLSSAHKPGSKPLPSDVVQQDDEKHELKRLKCRFCDKTYANRRTRKSHEHTHTGSKPYKCQYCVESFRTYKMCKSHECVHTGVKPYQCKFCERSFTDCGHWKIHERSHTGEKPYLCQFCGKGFVGSSQCRNHERNVHSGAPKKKGRPKKKKETGS